MAAFHVHGVLSAAQSDPLDGAILMARRYFLLVLSLDAGRWLLPQLIPRSLPSRHEMSTFLGRIRDFPKTSPRTEGDANADPRPAVFACAYPLGRRNTCSCRA